MADIISVDIQFNTGMSMRDILNMPELKGYKIGEILAIILSRITNKALSSMKRTSELLQVFLVNSVRRITFVVGFVVALSMLEVEIDIALENPEWIREALGLGVECVAWTVDDPHVARRALEVGITRITTNEVERLQTWRDSLG